jgi:hypothetical protein
VPEEQTRPTKEWITGQMPLKGFGHPDEIAGAVLYLAYHQRVLAAVE